jgi:hypothetical protein
LPDGKPVWKQDVPAKQPEEAKVRDHGYASSTPLVDADRVYVFFGKSGVAFGHDGRELWRAEVGAATHGWVPRPHRSCIGNSSSSTPPWKRIPVALNKTTGGSWRERRDERILEHPILVHVAGGRPELVVAIMGKVLGFDGHRRIAVVLRTGIRWYMVPSLVNDADTVYCIGGRAAGRWPYVPAAAAMSQNRIAGGL